MLFDFNKKIIIAFRRLPDVAGIYLFYNKAGELVYAGKATSLKSRVASYFKGIIRSGSNDKMASRPIEGMIHEVVDIKWRETGSVLEAVILEALYIKKFQPKYNVLGKDDKSWNYIVITKDEFPRVLTMREHELSVIARSKERVARQSPSKLNKVDSTGQRIASSADANRPSRNDKYIFGPFPGLNTKAVMKILRRLFRFSTCRPPKIGQSKGQACLYYQMGQCLGVCTGEISAKDYRQKTIRPLAMFLSGHTKQVTRLFAGEMRGASRRHDFEQAARWRDQLRQLQKIQDMALLNASWFDRTLDSGLWTLDDNGQGLKSKVQKPFRIEGYDISNLGATEKVGSMVVFNQWGPVKSEYRKFIIKTVPGQSDVDCLAEVLERRLRHAEWPLPDAILIDGGRPQVQIAKRVVGAFMPAVPIVGIAKGPRRRRNDFILGSKNPAFISWVSQQRDLLIQIRDEAHRFAIAFHRARRGRALTKSFS